MTHACEAGAVLLCSLESWLSLLFTVWNARKMNKRMVRYLQYFLCQDMERAFLYPKNNCLVAPENLLRHVKWFGASKMHECGLVRLYECDSVIA